MATKQRIWPDIAIHPGETLAEELAARGMTQRHLAEQMGRPVQLVNELCNGRRAITADTAWDLEAALGITAELWMNLQTHYDLVKARLKRQEREQPANA